MTDDEPLQLAGIKHFAFCPRRWALIHVEQQWQENARTAEGHILHEKAHSGLREKRGDLIITRSMPVASQRLGVSGECDVVEWHLDPLGVDIPTYAGKYRPVPVEYKRGRPMENDADLLQLCAQAMCLEEMLLCAIPEGFLYYDEIRRRQPVSLAPALRCRVAEVCGEMHRLFEKRHTPKPKRTPMCASCSLNELCLPRLGSVGSAAEYIRTTLEVDAE